MDGPGKHCTEEGQPDAEEPGSVAPRAWAAQRRLPADRGHVLRPAEDGRKRAESMGDRVLFQVLKRT